MKSKLISLFAIAVFSGTVCAQQASDASRPPPPPPHEKNPAFEAAIKECASSVAKDAQGRPDFKAMDACMSAKGFKRPPPPKGEGHRPPPPPSSDSNKQKI